MAVACDGPRVTSSTWPWVGKNVRIVDDPSQDIPSKEYPGGTLRRVGNCMDINFLSFSRGLNLIWRNFSY